MGKNFVVHLSTMKTTKNLSPKKYPPYGVSPVSIINIPTPHDSILTSDL